MSGFCYTSEYDTCNISKDPNDPNAYCTQSCDYVSTPPHGCVWSDSLGGCVNRGCNTGGYSCMSTSPGICQCVDTESINNTKCRYSDYMGQCEDVGCYKNPGYGCLPSGDKQCSCKELAPKGDWTLKDLTAYGYCYKSQDGLCAMSNDGIDNWAKCDENCNYISSPPYGCSWDPVKNTSSDYGCASGNPGYSCVCKDRNCKCINANNQSWTDWFNSLF